MLAMTGELGTGRECKELPQTLPPSSQLSLASLVEGRGLGTRPLPALSARPVGPCLAMLSLSLGPSRA